MYYFGLKNCTFFGDWVFVCGAIGVMVEDVAVVLFKILVCVPCVFVLYLNKLRFIGEEESEASGIPELTDDPTWIIDPIDGTANFIRQLRMSAVSVGLVIRKQQTLGIVYNPFTNECYTAIKGQGAFLNGKRIRTNGETDISKVVFAYEISLARNPKYLDLYMYRLKHLMRVVSGYVLLALYC
ncbi:unnamed protein product [Acanthoscelides obtectus]|uniref:inositol-phosphate phosphatase n=1 Tax=Acanthoscelides obtectus TaxID=200917 RepID=A0A9P0K651_ACAOB|nr:unnamed protein product [Acanthoscelides obtectus]CAK1653231.1 Inositol monophosphatase 3 [Acanthoscelides obtectus]